jgi:XTP/dITP diphosphohydrolase
MSHTLILGTTNAGKLRELVELLAPHGISCRSLQGLTEAVAVEETGQTFADNAVLKATIQAQALGGWVLAEDSGLVVPVLDGAPGIYSARFSGPGATDSANNALLLQKLDGITGSRRAAHYACHAALADPSGTVVATASGTCSGFISAEAAGGGGFGYDPLFVVAEYHRTFGELSAAVKAVISHRARAMRGMLPAILRHLG